jgi:hypothetical protein
MVRLPVELYEAVSKYCYRSDLTALAHVSRTTQLEAERILYRDVRFPGNSEIGAIVYVVMFCKQICQSPRRAAYVTSLQSKIWVGTKNCFSLSLRKLFSHAIASMPHLRTLRVLGSDLFDFSMLAQSHLKLWTFESDSNDRTAVSQFLINNQSDLRSISLWLILPSTVHHTLSPRLSPNLTVLVANARDTSRIMSGRPISHLCIWDYATPVFASLPEAATMIKVLRVFLVSHTVMETIARVVPNLEVVWVQLSITTLNVRPTRCCGHIECLLIRTVSIGNGGLHYRAFPLEESARSGDAFPNIHSLEFGIRDSAISRQSVPIDPYTDSEQRNPRSVDLEIGHVRDRILRGDKG